MHVREIRNQYKSVGFNKIRHRLLCKKKKISPLNNVVSNILRIHISNICYISKKKKKINDYMNFN